MMQTDKKTEKREVTDSIMTFLFVPIMRVKTTRTKDYIKKDFFLFGFIPLFGLDMAVPVKQKDIADIFDV